MFSNFLNENKKTIVNLWFDSLVDVFPKDNTHFLKKNKDQFANPIGTHSKESLTFIIDEIINGFDEEKLKNHIMIIAKILAIQNIPPTRALSFIFSLKKIVHSLKKNKPFEKELEQFNDKVDNLFLICVDAYISSREQIYKFKAEHIKTHTYRLLKKADLLKDVPEFGIDIIPQDVYKSDAFQAELNNIKIKN